MTTNDISPEEFDSYYGRYIYKLDDNLSLQDSFENGKIKIVNFFGNIPEDKLSYRYNTDKWNCKEILQHLIDTERIFMYRCFRIARHDKTELAGFNQNIYIQPSRANEKSLDELIQEFQAGREHSLSLLNSLSDTDLIQVGSANGGPMSARAAAFTITGHEIWHMEIITEKYL
ncbi:DinB family protein [Maribacter aestuarii]|uniref:DinB family protein n=1 Tax=Maribacter aestuarii TaxID=1130723 RepID=UPI00248D24FF|nr:DinB family protein [Maribacter aestuarii]